MHSITWSKGFENLEQILCWRPVWLLNWKVVSSTETSVGCIVTKQLLTMSQLLSYQIYSSQLQYQDLICGCINVMNLLQMCKFKTNLQTKLITNLQQLGAPTDKGANTSFFFSFETWDLVWTLGSHHHYGTFSTITHRYIPRLLPELLSGSFSHPFLLNDCFMINIWPTLFFSYSIVCLYLSSFYSSQKILILIWFCWTWPSGFKIYLVCLRLLLSPITDSNISVQ